MLANVYILIALLVIGGAGARLDAQATQGLSVKVEATTAGTGAWIIEQKQISELPLDGRSCL